jgi:hypothetical protein
MGPIHLLRRRLAVTTVVTVAPFLGYGREAYAACDLSNAPTILCSGVNLAPQDIPIDHVNHRDTRSSPCGRSRLIHRRKAL